MIQNKITTDSGFIPDKLVISDMGCAVALIVSGFYPIDFDKSDPMRVRFVFQYDERADKITNLYFLDELEVKARNFWDTAKAIKNKLRN